MVYAPNANWTAAIDDTEQQPVFFLRLDGTTEDYSTAPVKSAGTTKVVLMDTPKGFGSSLDAIDGRQTVAQVKVRLVDADGDVTQLVATESAGAPVASLKNRAATIYGGYRHLAEADYAKVHAGRVTAVKLSSDLTSYELTISAPDFLLDGELMTGATDTEVATITGNPVNVYWSLLTGTFDTGHATFPLDSVSVYSAGVSSVPTGLGLATSEINETQLVAERDLWLEDATVTFEWGEPTQARGFIEDELLRVFQAFPAISAEGLIGFRLLVPPIPQATVPEITEDEIVNVRSWTRAYDDHLNKFTYKGDYNLSTDEFDATLYNTETAEDTTNQTTTGETIEYLLESKGLTDAAGGAALSTILANRMRIRYRSTPAEIELETTMVRRDVEQGDVVSVTHSQLPNLSTGARGVVGKMMRVVSISADYARGTLRMKLTDTGFDRYGAIAPSGQADYDASSTVERGQFAFVGAAATNLIDGEPGYEVA